MGWGESCACIPYLLGSPAVLAVLIRCLVTQDDRLTPYVHTTTPSHNLPTQTRRYSQIINQLTWMTHAHNLKRVSQEHKIDLYLRPPNIGSFKLMDYHLMNRIVKDAYRWVGVALSAGSHREKGVLLFPKHWVLQADGLSFDEQDCEGCVQVGWGFFERVEPEGKGCVVLPPALGLSS